MKRSDKRVVSGSSSALAAVDNDRFSGNNGRMEPLGPASLTEKTLELLKLIEVDLAVIKSNYATKEDIAKLKEDIAKLETTLIKWFIGTAVAIAGVAFAAAKLIR